MSEAQLVEARTRGEGNVSTLRRKPRKGRKEAAALAETDKVKAQARIDVQAIESKAEVAAFKKEPQELKYTARIRHSSAGKNWKPWRSCPSWPAQEYTSGLISMLRVDATKSRLHNRRRSTTHLPHRRVPCSRFWK